MMSVAEERVSGRTGIGSRIEMPASRTRHMSTGRRSNETIQLLSVQNRVDESNKSRGSQRLLRGNRDLTAKVCVKVRSDYEPRGRFEAYLPLFARGGIQYLALNRRGQMFCQTVSPSTINN